MVIILYFRTVNIAVKMQMENKKDIIVKKITFTDYYNGLDKDEKRAVKTALRKYMSETHFHLCVRTNRFTSAMQYIIYQLTNIEFDFTHEKTK